MVTGWLLFNDSLSNTFAFCIGVLFHNKIKGLKNWILLLCLGGKNPNLQISLFGLERFFSRLLYLDQPGASKMSGWDQAENGLWPGRELTKERQNGTRAQSRTLPSQCSQRSLSTTAMTRLKEMSKNLLQKISHWSARLTVCLSRQLCG